MLWVIARRHAIRGVGVGKRVWRISRQGDIDVKKRNGTGRRPTDEMIEREPNHMRMYRDTSASGRTQTSRVG